MTRTALPLASCRQFASRDFAAMHERLCLLLKPHGLRRVSSAPVRGLIRRAQVGNVALNVLRLGPAVDVTPGALESFYLLQVPLVGRVELELGGERVLCAGRRAAVVSPGDVLRLRWSENCAQLVVQIPRDVLEIRLAERLGYRPRTRLRFQPAMDLLRAPSRELRMVLDIALHSIELGGVLAGGALGGKLEDLLLSTLLAAQPHNYTMALHEDGRLAPRHVLRAERAMRELEGERLSVARLAAFAGVGVRTLHEGFRRFRDSTPMRRLTELRLHEARMRLSAATPGTKVSQVAADLGFLQFGRFARLYRTTFGELPSQTLRGAASRPSAPESCGRCAARSRGRRPS